MRRVLTYALVYGATGAIVGAMVAIYTRDTTHEVNPGVYLDRQPQTPRSPAEAVTPARNVSRNGQSAQPVSDAETVAETVETPQTTEVEVNE